ncbi:50S ribosomal protein L28 [Candidatus Giovannonibacteria bacterium]|nr:50S ribosomal protein L28 [Candidatus Giovannonibacteria bacterium]
MAKACLICGKGSRMGGTRVLLRGNYNPTKKSRKYPNLQWASLPAGPLRERYDGASRIKICTRCIKAGKNLQITK